MNMKIMLNLVGVCSAITVMAFQHNTNTDLLEQNKRFLRQISLMENIHRSETYRIEKPLASKKVDEQPVRKQSKFKRTDWFISLFRSEQEREFYEALKRVFPNHFVYPNVAVSNIFSLDRFHGVLSKDEERYFLMAVVDFVVYGTAEHMPEFFFEVDSHYHDTPEATIKDNMKNKIFDAAGIELFRIRMGQNNITHKFEFESMIKKALANPHHDD